jgi:hypothetical protein
MTQTIDSARTATELAVSSLSTAVDDAGSRLLTAASVSKLDQDLRVTTYWAEENAHSMEGLVQSVRSHLDEKFLEMEAIVETLVAHTTAEGKAAVGLSFFILSFSLYSFVH